MILVQRVEGARVIIWLRSVGIAFVVVSGLIAGGSGVIIAASAYGAKGADLWEGLASLGSGMVFAMVGVLLIHRASKGRVGWPWGPRTNS